jgi:plasmid stability protein
MTPPKPKLRKRQVDLLLLSIIRAYDHPGRKSEAERLAIVREALFGEKRGRGRTAAFDDLALFKVIDEVRKRELDGLRRAIAKKDEKLRTTEWEAEIARDPMKVREAARRFAELAGKSDNVSDDAVEHRLRRKAGAQLTTREMAEIESLFDPDAPHTRTMIAVLELLENLGVQSETIWDENT